MEDDGKCQSQLLMYRCDFLNDGLKELHGKNHMTVLLSRSRACYLHFARFTAYAQVSESSLNKHVFTSKTR